MLTHSDPPSRTASVPESEDAIRNLKASEAVVAAFFSAGFQSPGGELAAIIANYVKSETRGIPVRELASMTPGSGPLSASATAGVNQYLATLTPQQRDAAKAGVNPLDPVAVQKFNLGLNIAGAMPGREFISEGSGGRYAGLRAGSAEALGSVALASSYTALTKEGYTATQLNAVMPYAKELGWTDKAAVRALADTGPAGGELAKKWNDARKRGDKEGMRAAEEEAAKRAKDAKSPKEKRGYEWMQKKFKEEGLKTKADLSTGTRPEEGSKPMVAASHMAASTAVAKSNDAAAANVIDALGVPAPAKVATTGTKPSSDGDTKPKTVAKVEPKKPSGPVVA